MLWDKLPWKRSKQIANFNQTRHDQKENDGVYVNDIHLDPYNQSPYMNIVFQNCSLTTAPGAWESESVKSSMSSMAVGNGCSIPVSDEYVEKMPALQLQLSSFGETAKNLRQMENFGKRKRWISRLLEGMCVCGITSLSGNCRGIAINEILNMMDV